MSSFEPVDIGNILTAVIAGALLVFFGAVYAACFALGRMYRSVLLVRVGYLAFALLALCAGILVVALKLDPMWRGVAGVILAGYLIAPQAIWRLSVATHGTAGNSAEPGSAGE